VWTVEEVYSSQYLTLSGLRRPRPPAIFKFNLLVLTVAILVKL